jgi:hypothetical protein
MTAPLFFSPELVAETSEEERAALRAQFAAEHRKWVEELIQTLIKYAKCPEEYDVEVLARQILGED